MRIQNARALVVLILLVAGACTSDSTGSLVVTVLANGQQSATVRINDEVTFTGTAVLDQVVRETDLEDIPLALHTWLIRDASGNELLRREIREEDPGYESVRDRSSAFALESSEIDFAFAETGTYTATYASRVWYVTDELYAELDLSVGNSDSVQIVVTDSTGEPPPTDLTLDPDAGPAESGIFVSGMEFDDQDRTANTVTFMRRDDGALIQAPVTGVFDTPDPDDGDAKGLAVTVPPIASVDEFNPFAPVPVEQGLIDPRSPATDVDPLTAVGLAAVDVDVKVSVDGAPPSTGTATFHYQPTRFLKELWFSQEFDQILPHVVALDGSTLYYVDRNQAAGFQQRLRRAKLQPGVSPQPVTLADLENGWYATALLIEGDVLYLASAPEVGVKRRIQSMQLSDPVLDLVIEETSTAPWQYDGLALDQDEKLYFTDSGGDYVGVIDLTVVPIKAEPFAGKRFENGDVDGAGEDARLDAPETIAYHNGQLYIGANGKIKRIDPGTTQVTSLQGTDGSFLTVSRSFAFDSLGNLLVARGPEGIDWISPAGPSGWEFRENLQAVILASGSGLPRAASHPAEATLLVTDSDTLLVISIGGGAHRLALE